MKVLSISVGFTVTHQLTSVEILPILKSSLFMDSSAEEYTPPYMLVYILIHHHILATPILFGAFCNLDIVEVF